MSGKKNVLAASHNLVNGRTLLGMQNSAEIAPRTQVLHLNHVRLLNVQTLVNTTFSAPLIVQRRQSSGRHVLAATIHRQRK